MRPLHTATAASVRTADGTLRSPGAFTPPVLDRPSRLAFSAHEHDRCCSGSAARAKLAPSRFGGMGGGAVSLLGARCFERARVRNCGDAQLVSVVPQIFVPSFILFVSLCVCVFVLNI